MKELKAQYEMKAHALEVIKAKKSWIRIAKMLDIIKKPSKI